MSIQSRRSPDVTAAPSSEPSSGAPSASPPGRSSSSAASPTASAWSAGGSARDVAPAAAPARTPSCTRSPGAATRSRSSGAPRRVPSAAEAGMPRDWRSCEASDGTRPDAGRPNASIPAQEVPTSDRRTRRGRPPGWVAALVVSAPGRCPPAAEQSAGPGAPLGTWPLVAAEFGTRGYRGPAPYHYNGAVTSVGVVGVRIDRGSPPARRRRCCAAEGRQHSPDAARWTSARSTGRTPGGADGPRTVSRAGPPATAGRRPPGPPPSPGSIRRSAARPRPRS